MKPDLQLEVWKKIMFGSGGGGGGIVGLDPPGNTSWVSIEISIWTPTLEKVFTSPRQENVGPPQKPWKIVYLRKKETQQAKYNFCMLKWRFGEISFENFLLSIYSMWWNTKTSF